MLLVVICTGWTAVVFVVVATCRISADGDSDGRTLLTERCRGGRRRRWATVREVRTVRRGA